MRVTLWLRSVSFAQLGVSPALRRRLQARGVTAPVAIQTQAIPAILRGNSRVFVQAETGAGKTLAYLLPLAVLADARPLRAVVAVPTRELALQVALQARHLVPTASIALALDDDAAHQAAVAGADAADTLRESAAHDNAAIAAGGLELLIGPPRMLLPRVTPDYAAGITHIVLDEADKLVAPIGRFASARKQQKRSKQPRPVRILVDRILQAQAAASEQFQLIGVSASLTQTTRREMFHFGWTKRSGAFARTSQAPTLPPSLEHAVVQCTDRRAALAALLKAVPAKATLLVAGPGESVARTAADLATLPGLPVAAAPLYEHVHHSQKRTIHELFAAREELEQWLHSNDPEGKLRVAVASPDAIRGLDFAGIDHVILMGLPPSQLEYIHAAGRTARCGRAGRVTTVVTTDKELLELSRFAHVLKFVPSLWALTASESGHELMSVEWPVRDEAASTSGDDDNQHNTSS
eukprot:m.305379 g.305379  ORF g.305379 m.305379 type:complete len:466 (-) comp17789_c0_seq1:92-1489(-)